MQEERATDKRKAALAALALLVLVTVPLALWGSSSGDGGDALTVSIERSGPSGPVQVVLAFEDADTIAGEPAQGQLRAECRDAGGRIVVSAQVPLPLDTDDGKLAPHAHVNATSEQAERISSCALLGFERPYEGRVR